MDGAFQTYGNVTLKMIAAMDRMKEISVLKKLAHTSSLLVREPAIAFLNLGSAMVTMIVSINR